MTNSEARKRHATPPTPDALDAIGVDAIRALAAAARQPMTCGGHKSIGSLIRCEECIARRNAAEQLAVAMSPAVVMDLLTALEEARAEVQVEGNTTSLALEVNEQLRHALTAAESARDAAEGAIERVRAAYEKACKRSALPSGWTVDDWEDFTEGLLHDVSAALAPVTTDETEGGGVDE